jgi:hypothetical protein
MLGTNKETTVNIEFAKELISNPDKETVDALFDGVDGAVWVDWRADDAEIFNDIFVAIEKNNASANWEDNGDLMVNLNGNVTKIPLKGEQGDRDIAIKWVNKIIAPEYEIRFIKASEGGDTLAFMPLLKSQWDSLRQEYGDDLDKAFETITDESAFFI